MRLSGDIVSQPPGERARENEGRAAWPRIDLEGPSGSSYGAGGPCLLLSSPRGERKGGWCPRILRWRQTIAKPWETHLPLCRVEPALFSLLSPAKEGYTTLKVTCLTGKDRDRVEDEGFRASATREGADGNDGCAWSLASQSQTSSHSVASTHPALRQAWAS